MKILFFGTGGIGGRHAAAIREMRPDAELIAVRQEPSEVIETLEMQRVPDMEAGLALDPQAAVIALPPALHADVVRPVLSHGVAAYVEKPVATRCADLEEAVSAAEGRGTVTMVGCNLRFLPAFRQIKELLSKGRLGCVRHASLSVGQWLPNWREHRDYRRTYSASAEMGGGVILDLIHEIDLARYWFGEFSDVAAVAGNTGALEIDSEDHADIVLSSAGMDVSIHLDYLDREGHRSGRIIAEHGTLTYDAILGRLDIFTPESAERETIAGPDSFVVAAAARAALTHFLDCVEAGRATEQPLREGLRSLSLAEAARKSAGISG